MPAFDFSYTTGASQLADVEELSYNGCVFSPLFESKVSGEIVKDEANRATKYIQYTITVDGYVTLADSTADSIQPNMLKLRKLLSQPGGKLIYKGRGCDIVVNGQVNTYTDLAWGPIPLVIEFQPLGSGRSAKISWQVKVHISEQTRKKEVSGIAAIPMLQFNYESSLSYGEDGYSTITVKGVLEIPLTRTPTQSTRTLTQTVDDLRDEITKRVMKGVDLNEFRVTQRDINISRDKRTMQWSFRIEQKPYMDLPENCNMAKGTYTVRPAKAGAGLSLWLCTLRATYTVRIDRPRRTAWLLFLELMLVRMAQSTYGDLSDELLGKVNAVSKELKPPSFFNIINPIVALNELKKLQALKPKIEQLQEDVKQNKKKKFELKPILIDFTVEEGLYLDSKTTTFSATWRLTTTHNKILLASGLWVKVPEIDTKTQPPTNLWAASMQDISGMNSVLVNRLDPSLDVIVDFGL